MDAAAAATCDAHRHVSVLASLRLSSRANDVSSVWPASGRICGAGVRRYTAEYDAALGSYKTAQSLTPDDAELGPKIEGV